MNFKIHFSFRKSFFHSNMIIFILIQINRLNLLILKGHFKRKIRYRIRWGIRKTVLNNTLYPFWQILDRLYWKTKLRTFVPYSFIFLYVCLFSPITFLLLSLLYTFNLNVQKEEVKKEEEVVLIKKTFPNVNLFEECCSYSEVDEMSKLEKLENDEGSLNVISDKYEPLLHEKIHKDARESLIIDNAGGTSTISEAYSIHILSKKMKSEGCIFEMGINYWCRYKMMDYILSLKDDVKIGVSVVRALCFYKLEFTFEDALYLLRKKINGLIISRKTVIKDHSFSKSILHIFSPSEKVTNILLECLKSEEFDVKNLEIIGTLDIWITTSGYKPIFNNGNNAPAF